MRSGGPTSQNGPDVLIRGQLPPISLIVIECSVMRWLIGSIIALGRAINTVIRNESHSYAVSSMWDLFQSWTVLCLLGWQLFGPLLCMSPIMVMVDWCKYRRHKLKHCYARRAHARGSTVSSEQGRDISLRCEIGLTRHKVIQTWQIVKLPQS